LALEELSMEEEKQAPEEGEEILGPLPDLGLSADTILERLGAEAVTEPDELNLDGFFEEVEEETEDTATEETTELLPELDFDTEPEDVGVLPDPFGDEEEEVKVEERAWFIVHCYSGYEHKVRHNLELRIESMAMQEFIFQVVVPTVEEIELKDGKRRTVERCLYPGYLMVQMLLTDDSWYVVRNTPGVTGFVGMGNKPTPLRSEAVQRILRRMESTAPEVRATFKRNQKVRIIEGPFADFIGVVDDIDEERTRVRVLVSFFGRETPVELDFLQVEKT
jgi:transcription termination/antitermination protein NusG